MILIGPALGMASRASEDRVVGRVGVTGGTHAIRSTMVGREPSVIESGALPRIGVVTGLAGSWKIRRCVVRIRRGLIVGLVTGIAVRRNRSVVGVHVTTGAGDRCVLAGERERCVVVIERRRDPRCRVMAHLALLREPRLNVVGTGRAVEILRVARDAACVGQAVIAVHMA